MGIFSGWRAKRVAKSSLKTAEEIGGIEALAEIGKELNRGDPEPAVEFAKLARDSDKLSLAIDALELVLKRYPDHHDALGLKAEIHLLRGENQAAKHMLEQILEKAPNNFAVARGLAKIYAEEEDYRRVVEVLEPAKDFSDEWTLRALADAYFASGKYEDAIDILEPIIHTLETRMRTAMSEEEFEALKEAYEDYEQMHSEAVAQVHGREEGVLIAAHGGRLDANAGINYRLLGDRLMLEAVSSSGPTELRTIKAMEQEGEHIYDHNRKDHRGLVLRASVALRTGRFDKAQDLFKKAIEQDGRDFASYRGLGVAMDAQTYGFKRYLAKLPELNLPESLPRVVPDYGALGKLERTVVDASVHPLRFALDRLAKRGVKIRILPIDVRATDLEAFSINTGERFDDHRTFDASTGLATDSLAISKVEELLDVTSPASLTFAHEYAHLVYFHFEPELKKHIDRLMLAADSVGYVCDEYQMKNLDEFMAVSYEKYVRVRYDLRHDIVEDEEGVWRSIKEFFDALSVFDSLSDLTVHSLRQ